MRIAILDDYQSVALTMADWWAVHGRADVIVFSDHIADEDTLAERLAPFDILCVMRERTALGRSLIARLPKLKLIASTGFVNAAVDVVAAAERGIDVVHTDYSSTPAIEMTWALILASQRHLIRETASLRAGGWQGAVGGDLHGRTLGLLGLGHIGGAVARIGVAFGMRVIGWSQNLTSDKAEAVGATAVSREELFAGSDILSIHTLLSRRTRGLVDAAALAAMKPTAWLVNTSRGAIVEEAALLEALRHRRIEGYAVDVFDTEPLPVGHPFRHLDNVLATPHLGYVTNGLYRTFYGETVRNILDWLDRSWAAMTAACPLFQAPDRIRSFGRAGGRAWLDTDSDLRMSALELAISTWCKHQSCNRNYSVTKWPPSGESRASLSTFSGMVVRKNSVYGRTN